MRTEMSLNGLWKFCPAFDAISADQRWLDSDFDPKDPDLMPVTAGAARGWIKADYDDSHWLDITIPNSWNAAIRDLWSYEGHGWLRRTVQIPAAWSGKRVEFISEGANYRVALYINGELAGDHEGGYNPFSIPVHRLLRYGETNVIAVVCDNIPKPDRSPGGQFGWWNHGGLYRDVRLRVMDTTYVDDVTVVTEVSGKHVDIEIAVEVVCEVGEMTSRRMEIELFDPAGAPVEIPPERASQMLTLSSGMAKSPFSISVNEALLWSPEEPNLYTLRVKLTSQGQTTDEWSHRIGMRTLRVDGTQMLLNGKPLLIKGVNRHEQYFGSTIHSPTHTEAQIAQDVDLIKWLGGNAIRQHYPNHRRLYELCDEHGILCMVENPLWQWGRPLVQTDHAGALGAAKKQIAEIIRTYKNHACVFMWSVSNENLVKAKSDDPEVVALANQTISGNKELVALAKKLDPTRPVVEPSNEWPGDAVLEDTDVSAVNVYVGNPVPHVSGATKIAELMKAKMAKLREEIPGKPILAAEFGEWTVRGLAEDNPPGENYQTAKLTALWNGFMDEPDIIGGFIWVFADYDLHRRFLWAYEYRCAYGLFDIERKPKAAAYAIRKLWKGK
jgi:beta-glucuronidase